MPEPRSTSKACGSPRARSDARLFLAAAEALTTSLQQPLSEHPLQGIFPAR